MVLHIRIHSDLAVVHVLVAGTVVILVSTAALTIPTFKILAYFNLLRVDQVGHAYLAWWYKPWWGRPFAYMIVMLDRMG